MKTLIVGMDGSSNADHALQMAIDLARRLDAGLVLVSVVQPMMTSPDSVALDIHLMEEAQHHADALLAQAQTTSRASGVPADVEVRFGSPADGLCKAAHERSAYMVVVGSHGRGVLARAVMGSVAGRLLHTCDIPILVVKHPQP